MWGFFSGGGGGGGGGGGSSASSSDGEAASAVSRVSVSRPTGGKAVKWIGMKRAEGDGAGGDQMFVGVEATRALAPLGDQRVNLISIFGAARQGKSFLMNLLADQQDLFKISNLREPCTQGVDLSGYFVPLKDFSAVNGCRPVTTSAGQEINVGFVDAEGQGDRDITYDSRLVSPVLLTSKVVIFNWKDSLQADRILNLLAVLARAAQGIELAEDDSVKVFGHLHLVFRDWNFVNSTPEEVFNDLFKKEKGFSNEVNVRNSARTTLQEAFKTINVWLFPPPVENTANLREKIRFEQLHHSFQDKLCEFRTTLSQQLKEPTLFYTKQLTARLLTDVMPALVETLNSDQVIMPESIFSSIVRAQANAVKERCQRTILDHVEAIAVEEVMSNDELEKLLNDDVGDIIDKAISGMSNVPANVMKEIKESLHIYAKKEIQIALHANNEKITSWVSKEADTVFQNLKRECSLLEKNALPMKRDSLKVQWTALLHAELAKVEQLPTGLNGRRDIDRECNRIRQHGEILFDKIDVANERAIQRSSAAVTEALRKAKTRLTNEMNDFVNAKFASKQPISIIALKNELEARYAAVKKDLVREAGEIAHFTLDFSAELETHKSQISDELNRHYYIEVKHILNEVGYNARDNLSKEASRRLDGKLPLLNEEIKKEMDEAVNIVKKMLHKSVLGWTIQTADATDKANDLEKFADTLTDQYLRRNQELEVDVNARREKEQYDKLRVKILKSFEDAIKAIGLPMDDVKIDEIFRKVLQDEAARFLSFAENKTCFTIKELRESLTSDCRSFIDTEKFLNSVAQEKRAAVQTAERERQLREAEEKTAHERERQISELKHYVSQSEHEKESESKRLHDRLANEERKRRQIELEMEHHHARFAQLETDKRNAELRAQAESRRDVQARETEALRVKRELEELQLRAAQAENEKRQLELHLQIDAQQRQDNDSLKRQLEELRSKAVAMERQQRVMEREMQEQVELRAYAEAEANRAAAAAELSAQAAIEAANIRSPFDVRRKRYLSGGSDDVDMEDAAHSPPARAPAKNSSSAAAPAERKKARGPVKGTKSGPVKKRMSLADARKAAQEEVERRVQARAQSLSSAKKKK